MDNDFIHADLSVEGIHYDGRISPERKHGKIVSWHVVLNDVFFGYISQDDGIWKVTEQRPHELVQAVGSYIEKNKGHIQTVE